METKNNGTQSDTSENDATQFIDTSEEQVKSFLDSLKDDDDSDEDDSETEDDSEEEAEDDSDDSEDEDDEEDDSEEDEDDSEDEDEDDKDSDKGKMTDKQKELFENQRKGSQKKITEINNKLYNSEKSFVEKVPERLKSLSEGTDPEIKLAKRIAKDLYKTSLTEALESLKKKGDDDDDDEGDNKKTEDEIRREVRRETELEFTTDSFYKENSLLDAKSKDFDKEIFEKFNKKLDRLKGDDILTKDELEEYQDEAYSLVTKHIESETKKKNIKKIQKKITTSSGKSAKKGNTKKTDNLDLLFKKIGTKK